MFGILKLNVEISLSKLGYLRSSSRKNTCFSGSECLFSLALLLFAKSKHSFRDPAFLHSHYQQIIPESVPLKELIGMQYSCLLIASMNIKMIIIICYVD